MIRPATWVGAGASACARALVVLAVAAAGCSQVPSLERLMQAQRLTSDMLVRFANAADAANRAVMAGTDEAAAEFAREAEQATLSVRQDADALKPLLEELGYADESRLLEQFMGRLSAYRDMDSTILGLAVENSNLKAQRLSFGPVRVEADAFRDALESVARSAPAGDAWQARALAATALSAVRAIQVLQAPHIAEADDAAMARLEEEMASSEAMARDALRKLAGLAPPGSRAQLDAAIAALGRFHDLNERLVALSRRNSNVLSLALSLGRKRILAAQCEENLRAIQAALGKRDFPGTR